MELKLGLVTLLLVSACGQQSPYNEDSSSGLSSEERAATSEIVKFVNENWRDIYRGYSDSEWNMGRGNEGIEYALSASGLAEERNAKDVSKVKKDFYLKVVTGIKKINELGLVLLQEGVMYRDDVYHDRTGVMSVDDFNFLTKNGTRIGHNLVGSSCTPKFLDEDVNCDFLYLVNYLEFEYKFDGRSLSWVQKYAPDSLEQKIVEFTKQVGASIYKRDRYFSQLYYVKAIVERDMGSFTREDYKRQVIKIAENYHGPLGFDVIRELTSNK